MKQEIIIFVIILGFFSCSKDIKFQQNSKASAVSTATPQNRDLPDVSELLKTITPASCKEGDVEVRRFFEQSISFHCKFEEQKRICINGSFNAWNPSNVVYKSPTCEVPTAVPTPVPTADPNAKPQGKVVASACKPEAPFDATYGVCLSVTEKSVTVKSEYIDANSCVDHYVTAEARVEDYGRALRIFIYNFGPNGAAGANCSSASEDLGVLFITGEQDTPVKIVSTELIPIEYSMTGMGCTNVSGTTTSLKGLGVLGFCTGTGPQNPAFKFRVFGKTLVRNETYFPTECPQGTQHYQGQCYSN